MNFLSAEPHGDFLKIIWGPRKICVVSDLGLYWVALYRGSSVYGYGPGLVEEVFLYFRGKLLKGC